MPDYNNGVIYSIRFTDNDKLIYTGSTVQRFYKRLYIYKKDISTSFYRYIVEHYNYDFSKENCPCKSRQELKKGGQTCARGFKVNSGNTVINKNIPSGVNYEYIFKQNEEKKNARENAMETLRENAIETVKGIGALEEVHRKGGENYIYAQ